MTENYDYCILAVSRTFAQGCKLLQIIGRSEQSKGAKLQCCFAGLLFFLRALVVPSFFRSRSIWRKNVLTQKSNALFTLLDAPMRYDSCL